LKEKLGIGGLWGGKGEWGRGVGEKFWERKASAGALLVNNHCLKGELVVPAEKIKRHQKKKRRRDAELVRSEAHRLVWGGDCGMSTTLDA